MTVPKMTDPNTTRCCVYTVSYGPDEPLSVQEVRAQSNVDFIAFVDDPAITSETWQIRHLPPLLPDDPGRSSRYVKMHPHVLLSDYDASLYIDGSILLRRRPEDIFESLLFGVTDTMACVRHDQRRRIDEEAEAVAAWDLDDPAVVAEQLRAYALDGHDGTVPMISAGFLLRFHNDKRVVAFMEAWFSHVMAFSRRDQLSFPHVAEKLAFPMHMHDFDTESSEWYRLAWDPSKPRTPWRGASSEPPPPPENSVSRRLLDVSAHLEALGPAAVVRRAPTRDAPPSPWVPPSRLPAATVALRQLRGSLRDARDRLAGATAELAAAQAALAAKESELAAVRDALDAVHQSTSWRLTSPIRKCLDALRRRPFAR
ncbi:MAG: glycosyltransferase domain-containing protein [Thermoanaerobaculia bacterium]